MLIIWRTSPSQDWTIKEVRSGWKGICLEQGFVWKAKGKMTVMLLRTLLSIGETFLTSPGSCNRKLFKEEKNARGLKDSFFPEVNYQEIFHRKITI